MLDHGAQAILGRKTAAARQRPEPVPASPARSFALALGKAARKVMLLDLTVGKVESDLLSLAELLELPEELSLVSVLEGPRDALGVMVISPSLLSGFIEMQTTGRITASESIPRRPTRTDAVMTVTFVDLVLQTLEQGLAGTPDEIWSGRFRYASFLPEPRPLALILEDAPVRMFRAEVDLGEGLRHGTILLALPAKGRGSMRTPPRDRAEAAALTRQDAEAWSEALTGAVMEARAEVEAVLHRVTLPLSAVIDFAPGTVVPLPMAALDQVILQGSGGRTLAMGQLGAQRGHRALRLAEGDDAPEEALTALVPRTVQAEETALALPDLPEDGFPAMAEMMFGQAD